MSSQPQKLGSRDSVLSPPWVLHVYDAEIVLKGKNEPGSGLGKGSDRFRIDLALIPNRSWINLGSI
jgi:hypothetical protein